MGRQYEADGNRVAAADYSTTGQYLCVAIDATAEDRFALTTTDGQIAYGILQNAPREGQAGEIAVSGKCPCMYGANVTRGQRLKAEVTTARLVPIAADGDYCLGTAVESGVDGQIGHIMLQHQGLDQVA